MKQIRRKNYITRLVAGALFLGASISAEAAIYYIKNGGNDSSSGTSDANAWSSIGKLNSFNFQPGDQILMKRGSIWSQALQPSTDGTSGSRIVFQDYGSGMMPRLNPNNAATGIGAALTDRSGITMRNIRFATSFRGFQSRAVAAESKWILVDDCEFINCSYAADGASPGHGLTFGGTQKFTDVRVENNWAQSCTRAYVIEEAKDMPGLYELDVKNNTSELGKSGSVFLGTAMSGFTDNNTCFSTLGGTGVWFGVAGGRVQNSPAYLIKNFTWNNIQRASSNPDGVGFDFEGNCNGTKIHTCTSYNTDGPGVMVLATKGPCINIVITDVDITLPAENPQKPSKDYVFEVANTANTGTVNRGVWSKGQASAWKSPFAQNSYGWTYPGTSFVP